MALTLYSWQKECMDAWFGNRCRGMVNVVTGAGKTVFALAAMRRLEADLKASLYVKIVVPNRALMRQWVRALQDFDREPAVLREEIGCCGGTHRDAEDRKYMIYIINSARYCLARQILSDLDSGKNVLLIADECHRYASGENQKIFEFLPHIEGLPGNYYSLGLSATPRVQGYDNVLVPALGKEIYRYGFAAAARRETICPFFIYQIAVSFSETELAEYEDISTRITHIRRQLIAGSPWLNHMDSVSFFAAVRTLAGESGKNGKTAELAGRFLSLAYRRKGVVCMAAARIDCVCELVDRLDAKERIIIFGERIEQAEAVYRRLTEQYADRVGCYHSGMGQQARKNAMERFRDGTLRILAVCRAVDEGLDVPDATVGIILSGTSVERQRIQRLGRILRRKDGKESACLYYLFVKESGEEKAYFPKQGELFTACDLLYHTAAHTFEHPAYERAAFHMLAELKAHGIDERMLEETVRCLAAGIVRADWMCREDVFERKIQSADSIREKNYWICMKKLAGYRKKYGSIK